MGLHPRIGTFALLPLALFAGLVGGCQNDGYTDPPAPVLANRGNSAAVDQIKPGELAQGDVIAFGLALPRGMRLTSRFDKAVFADGTASAEDVANYFRDRVTAGRVETGPARTVFMGARANLGDGGLSGPTLRIEISGRPGRTEVVVRDETPAVISSAKSQEEVLREYGLGPDGKLLPKQELE